MVVNLLRSSHLSDNTLVHDDDLIGDGHGLALVVGDVDGRDSDFLLDAADLGSHLDTELCIEV